MAILDYLVGQSGLEEQRDRAIDFARDRYDPSQFDPMVDYATERAVEGIPEGQESLARQRTVESLFRPQDTSIYGGNQARAIAGQQRRSQQAMSGLADFESQLTQQDIQAQQQGRQQLAQTRTQQRQTEAQRDAAIEEAELQYETELQRRKQQLGSAVGNIAGTLAGSFLNPALGAAAGAAGGALFGGGGAVSGGLSGLTTSLARQQREDMINRLFGGESQQTTTEQTATTTQTSASLPNQEGLFGTNTLLGGGSQQPAQLPDQQVLFSVDELFGEYQAAEQAMNQPYNQQPQAPQTPSVPAQQPVDEIIPPDMSGLEEAQDFQAGEQMNLPTTSFSATGQYLGQGNLGGMSIRQLLESIFDQRKQIDITRTFSPLR